jgi:pyruvate,water dikinase
MAHTVGLDAPSAVERDLVGGKGASLRTLVRAGFRVPPGAVVTTDAYLSFIEAHDLAPKIRAIVDGIDFGDAVDVEQRCAEIRELITGAELPPAMAGEIRRVYQSLGHEVFVAVRSSGTAEDMAESSFAGQHDTYLDVRGEEAVVDAVQRCWASLWSARATAYRQRIGIEQGSVSIAVVIQAMISPESSGVLFTANPLTTAVDELVVNASWGLGEAIVSGIVTPDQYILNTGKYEGEVTDAGDQGGSGHPRPDEHFGHCHRRDSGCRPAAVRLLRPRTTPVGRPGPPRGRSRRRVAAGHRVGLRSGRVLPAAVARHHRRRLQLGRRS